MRELLQIGEVARLVGVSTKTIRYYHEIGLLVEPERTESGYRLYAAQHLLRLQRIRRLRALGLSLERIREILDEGSENNESTLRAALHVLIEETSAQILKLEERRVFLQHLLTSEELEPADKDAFLFLSPELKTQLAPHLAGLSAEWQEWGRRIDAMLGSFDWPAEYRQSVQALMQHIVDHAEQYPQLFALEKRYAALSDFPADAPEVEQLAEAYAQSQELSLLYQQREQYDISEKSPFANALGDLMSSVASPAQQRFFELLAQKINLQQSASSSQHTTGQEE